MTRFSRLGSQALSSVMGGIVITATLGAMLAHCLTLGALRGSLRQWGRKRS
jgi:hypothetical protein